MTSTTLEQAPQRLSDRIIDHIMEEYGLESLRQEGPPSEGTGYMTFRVATPNGVFALRRKKGSALKIRVKHPDIGASIDRQNRLMLFLREKGFPVAAPLLTKGQRTYVNVLGVPYSVYPFIEGTYMNPANPIQLHAWGETLGRYHQLTARYKGMPPKSQDSFLNVFHQELNTFRNAFGSLANELSHLDAHEDLENFKGHLDAVDLELNALSYNSLPRVVVHGDYKPGNVIFQGDRLAAVIDFGVSRNEVRIFDLAKSIAGLFNTLRKRAPLESVWTFFAAYDRVEPLDTNERKALPVVIEARIASKAMDKLAKLGMKETEEWKMRRVERFKEFARNLQWLRGNPEQFNALFHQRSLNQKVE